MLAETSGDSLVQTSPQAQSQVEQDCPAGFEASLRTENLQVLQVSMFQCQTTRKGKKKVFYCVQMEFPEFQFVPKS